MIAVVMPSHLTLAQPVHVEPEPIKRSRFVGNAAPVTSSAEAMAFVRLIRDRHAGAGHHCFAYRLGPGDDAFRVSDDGEPSGTGGQPILNHIDGASLQNVVIVVSRYFGGVKLGKGGLIRAYGGTAGDAIAAATVISVRQTSPLVVRCAYADQGAVEGIIRGAEGRVVNAEFGSDVALTATVPTEATDAVCHRIGEATAGRAAVEVGVQPRL